MTVDSTPSLGHRASPARPPRMRPRLRAWARTATLGTARELVWSDVRDGVIRLQGLSLTTRVLVRLGFVLVAGMVALLVFGDAVRHASPLLASPTSMPGRGTTVPTALLPVTLFMLSVAWTYLLAGALRAHWLLFVGVLAGYLAATLVWLQGTDLAVTSARGPLSLLGWAGLLAVPAVMIIGRVTRPVAWREYPLLLVCVGTTHVAAQLYWLDADPSAGGALLLTVTELSVGALGVIVLPMLVMAGIGVAAFGYRVATWSAVVARTGPGTALLPVAAVAVLGWQVWSVGGRAAAHLRGNWPAAYAEYAGALVLLLLLAVTFWGVERVTRRHAGDSAAPGDRPRPANALLTDVSRVGLPLAVAFFGDKVLAAFLAYAIGSVTALAGLVGATDIQAVTGPAIGLMQRLAAGVSWWSLSFDVGLLIVAAVLIPRGHRMLPLYLALVGVGDLWSLAVTEVPGLGALAWTGTVPVTFWMLVAVVGLTVALAVRHELAPARWERVLVVAAVVLLLNAPVTVSSASSVFLLSSGVAVIVFGLLWDAITNGNWANRDTAALPRVSRVLLYPGYLLLSLTIVTWSRVTHNAPDLALFTRTASEIGFGRFGMPLLIGLCMLALVEVLPRGAADTPGRDRA